MCVTSTFELPAAFPRFVSVGLNDFESLYDIFLFFIMIKFYIRPLIEGQLTTIYKLLSDSIVSVKIKIKFKWLGIDYILRLN